MTKNFKLEEFACKSGAPMPLSVRTNVERLAKNLQVLRDELKVPMTITSGHRSAEHNKKIGGATFSRHLMGMLLTLKRKASHRVQLLLLLKG